MTQQISPPVAAPAAPPSRGTQPARDDSTAPDSFSDALQAAHPGGAPPGEQTATDARTAQSGGGANGGDSSGATKKPKAAAPASADAQASALAAATQALAQSQTPAPAPTPAPAAAGQQPAAPAPGQGAIPTALAAAAAQLTATPAAAAAPARPVATGPAPAAPAQATDGAAPQAAAPVAQDASAATQAAAATADTPVVTAPAAAPAPVAPKARPAKQTATVQAAAGQAKQATAQNAATRFGSTAGDRQSSGNQAPQPGTAPLSADGQTAVGGQQGQAGAPVVTAQAPASAAPSVRTAELAERMQTVIRVANRQGSAAARITMRPAELGGVAVQIRAHDGGITARLTAETAVGAEALAEAGHELRRSLESAGVTVHGLDVQLNGQGTDAREGQGSGSRALAETLGASDGGGDDAAAEETETTIEPTRLPLAGSLVDVLV